MNLVMNEKLKHRLIGMAVIISLGALFVPAIVRNSSQSPGNLNVRVALPPKPTAPDIRMTEEKDVFKTIKIAKVTLADIPVEGQLPLHIKATPIKTHAEEQQPAPLVEAITSTKPESLQLALKEEVTTPPKPAAIKPVAKSPLPPKVPQAIQHKNIQGTQGHYGVQLASFSKLANAQQLMQKLRAKGYRPNLAKIPSRQGTIYKVSVGPASNKNEALRLKNQLAHALQLQGFVIETGVS